MTTTVAILTRAQALAAADCRICAHIAIWDVAISSGQDAADKALRIFAEANGIDPTHILSSIWEWWDEHEHIPGAIDAGWTKAQAAAMGEG